MWNVTRRRRNSYLQSKVKIMNPHLLNQCVEKARINPISILSKRKILNSQLNELEPKNFGPIISRHKAQLAYGLWGLPKIVHEISNKDRDVQYRALNTLKDLLLNPLECNRAIIDFDVVKKLETILLSIMPETRETMPTIDKVLTNFEILATNFEAAWRMVAQFELIQTLYYLIQKSNCTKIQPARILQLMSSHPTVADVMLIHGHLKHVADLLKQFERIEDLYIHLSNLIKRAPAGGMEAGLFKLLLPRIPVRSTMQPVIVKCLALLLSTPEGHEKFDRVDGVQLLYKMLKDDALKEETLEYVALAFQNCTINKKALWRCREFWDLPLILIRRAHSRTNDQLQLYCIQTLRQITAMPSVKDFVRKTSKNQIKAIECRKEFVSNAKLKLLQWLKKKNYKNIEPKPELEADKEEVHSEELSSESESESCLLLESSSTESSKLESEISDEPQPIAYRLDYGKICRGILPAKSESDLIPYAAVRSASTEMTRSHIGQYRTKEIFTTEQERNVIIDVVGTETGPVEGTIIEDIKTTTIFATYRLYNFAEQNFSGNQQLRFSPQKSLDGLKTTFPTGVHAVMADMDVMHPENDHPSQEAESFDYNDRDTIFIAGQNEPSSWSSENTSTDTLDLREP